MVESTELSPTLQGTDVVARLWVCYISPEKADHGRWRKGSGARGGVCVGRAHGDRNEGTTFKATEEMTIVYVGRDGWCHQCHSAGRSLRFYKFWLSDNLRLLDNLFIYLFIVILLYFISHYIYQVEYLMPSARDPSMYTVFISTCYNKYFKKGPVL